MIYAKVKDNKIEKYPVTFMEIRLEFPTVSFPENPTNNDLLGFGYAIVIETVRPLDTNTARVIETTPTLNDNGQWYQTYTYTEFNSNELAEKLNEISQDIRDNRNRMLIESDWTQLPDSPVDKIIWATYRQSLRDIPQQSTFPTQVDWPTKPLK